MKRFLVVINIGLFVGIAFPSYSKSLRSFVTPAKCYYINPKTGSNENDGSMLRPFKDLNKVSTLRLNPGDSVLLAAGSTFQGSLSLKDVHGAADKPIVISSYISGKKNGEKRALIDAKGYFSGVFIQNCSYIEVNNLVIQANGGGMKDERDKDKDMRCGVLVETTKSGIYEHIYFSGLLVKDIFYEDPGFQEPKYTNKKEKADVKKSQRFGWGIWFINDRDDALFHDLKVSNCEVNNVGHTGIKFTAKGYNKGQDKGYGIEGISVLNNRVIKVGGPGIQMAGVYKGIIRENYVDGSGNEDDSRKWGRGSGIWTWGTFDVLIEKNQLLNANGPGDSAGAHIDAFCKNVVLQYNFSANNAGGFCELLRNNYNCAYRYNISVNDGYRVKGIGLDFMEGVIFMLSGRGGGDCGPYNSYFYNNTIYVKKEIVAKFAVSRTSSGVYVANNIFVIEGKSDVVKQDQFLIATKDESPVNVVFENNLYLNESNWPKSVLIQDGKPIYGDPHFFNKGGFKITDYIPSNVKLVRDKGIEIMKLPNDPIGLTIGLKAEFDILGNKITGRPDMGAIELTK